MAPDSPEKITKCRGASRCPGSRRLGSSSAPGRSSAVRVSLALEPDQIRLGDVMRRAETNLRVVECTLADLLDHRSKTKLAKVFGSRG